MHILAFCENCANIFVYLYKRRIVSYKKMYTLLIYLFKKLQIWQINYIHFIHPNYLKKNQNPYCKIKLLSCNNA